MTFQREIRFS